MMRISPSKAAVATTALGLFAAGAACGWWLRAAETSDSGAAHVELAGGDSAGETNASDRGFKAFVPADFVSRASLALSIRSPGKREQAIWEAARSLDSAGIRDALEKIHQSRLPHRDDLVTQLFARWGELDPISALESAQTLGSAPARELALNAALSSWLETDAAAAERWVKEMPNGLLKNLAWDTLVSAVAVENPTHALALAMEGELPWERATVIAQSIFESWVGMNPQVAAAHALQLAPGPLREAALQTVANEWARTNITEALAWADSLPDQDYEAKRLNSRGTSPIYRVLETWMEKDSTAAVDWLMRLPEGKKKGALVASACTFLAWVARDPQVAAQLTAMLPDVSRRNAVVLNVAQQMASWEPAAALQWAREENSPESRNAIMTGLLSHLSGASLQRALEFAQTLSPADRENLLSIESRTGDGTRMWQLADPATLASWAERQPNNQETLNRIARSWTQADPKQALDWIKGLPAPARDTALNRIIDDAFATVPIDTTFDSVRHFQETERWILQLSEASARASAYEKLAQSWLSIDQESARLWIATSPLPPAAKERLLK